jgi:hypothetical protein
MQIRLYRNVARARALPARAWAAAARLAAGHAQSE